MGKSIISILLTLTMLIFVGCDREVKNDSDVRMQKQSEQAFAEANAQIGMPSIVNFQERKLAKMIFELRDQENLITYAYIVNLQGELIFLGKCMGFGLPYSVQYTNPNKIVDDPYRYQSCGKILLQADPNGLFMPEGLSATWLMIIDPKTGDARPVYVEPEILVSPFPLH